MFTITVNQTKVYFLEFTKGKWVVRVGFRDGSHYINRVKYYIIQGTRVLYTKVETKDYFSTNREKAEVECDIRNKK